MTPTFILEAFGELPITALVAEEVERERREWQEPTAGVATVGLLHAAFEARGELMGWSSASGVGGELWNLYNAGLTAVGDDGSLVGWVHGSVGSRRYPDAAMENSDDDAASSGGWATFRAPPDGVVGSVGLPVVISPLIQCLEDALRRIGVIEISGFQITCYGASPGLGEFADHLVSSAGWFSSKSGFNERALVSFDRGLMDATTASELSGSIRHRYTGSFVFGDVISVPENLMVRKPPNTPYPEVGLSPSEFGLSAGLPEWTAGAAGWTLAMVVDAAQAIAPVIENLSVRISRLK